MFYWYTYLNIIFVFRAVFKRSFVKKINNLKSGTPVIIAANHSNAFLDAVAVAAQVTRSVNYLVRSDVFNTPIKRFLLKAQNQIPIYRQRDGRDSLQKNQATFKEVYKLLENDKAVMIFPEADCFPFKRLRNLKKGTARMAFGVMEKNNWELDPHILPVGINYTHHTQMRTELMVGFGEPISVKKYEALYKENENKAIVSLTEEISNGIMNQLIHIPEEIEPLCEYFLALYRSKKVYNPVIWLRKEENRLFEEKGIVKKVEKLKNENLEKFETLEKTAQNYFELLETKSINDKAFIHSVKETRINLLTYLFFPIYIPMFLILKPIWNKIHDFVNKKIKKDEFKLSIKMGGLLVVYHAFYLIIFGTLWPLFGFWWAISGLFLFWLFSWFSILFNEAHKFNKAVWKARKWKSQNPASYGQASALRNQLVEFLG